MKQSEELRQQAEKEDNDLIAFGLYCKALREHRWERYMEHIHPRLSALYDVVIDNFRVVIDTPKYGGITLFPKVNKVMIHKPNKWIKPGMQWVLKNLIQTKGE